MYVDRIRHKQPNGTIYTQYLLRTSRREGKKTIKTTILNITNWGTKTCGAIAFAIKNRQSIAQLIEELPQRTCRTKTINPSCYKTKRYTLKRNPIRATEISDNRKSKLSRLKEIINNSNDYLKNYSPNLMALLFDNEFGVQWDRKTAAKANTII